MVFKLTSSAFADGASIPTQFTCEGKDTAPPLTVADAPERARSFAVIMDDPSAPNGTFTHWLAYDIPAGQPELPATTGKTLRNGFGRDGYGGPCPPPGHGPHRYIFTVYAVDVPTLPVRGDTRKALETALGEHTVGTARLVGRYERGR